MHFQRFSYFRHQQQSDEFRSGVVVCVSVCLCVFVCVWIKMYFRYIGIEFHIEIFVFLEFTL